METDETALAVGTTHSHGTDRRTGRGNRLDKTYCNYPSWAYGTKGAVRYEQVKRAKQYYPAVPREEAAAAEAASFLGRVFDGRLGLMVNTMVQQNGLTRSEIDELYAILKEAENK